MLSNFILLMLTFLSFPLAAQTEKISQLKSYNMCRIEMPSVREYDCQQITGQLLYNKVAVIPDKEIRVYPKGGPDMITIKWDPSKVRLNNDKDLYIYNFMATDLNKHEGSSIDIVMRSDYTVRAVVYYRNYEGQFMKFTMFDE